MNFCDLSESEQRITSQNGEDGVIAEILRRIGTAENFFVEFGVETGVEGNCVSPARQGWRGLFMEGDQHLFSKLERVFLGNGRVATRNALVTADNLDSLLDEEQVQVPEEIDVLSIDIDSNDYYVWESLVSRSPRIVVIEYNAQLGPDRLLVMPRDDRRQWDGTDYCGASASALRELGARKGYQLVYTEQCGVNAFFVRGDLMAGSGLPSGEDVVVRPPNHFRTGKGHPRDPRDRPWLDLVSGGLVTLGPDALA